MLNYVGPTIGPGPMSAALPPVTPGTMPQGVPGASVLPAPAPEIHIHHHGDSKPSPGALAAILAKAAPAPNQTQGPPPPPDYGTTTQEDGSILLHIKNPDGTLGPVVKVIPPIKRPE